MLDHNPHSTYILTPPTQHTLLFLPIIGMLLIGSSQPSAAFRLLTSLRSAPTERENANSEFGCALRYSAVDPADLLLPRVLNFVFMIAVHVPETSLLDSARRARSREPSLQVSHCSIQGGTIFLFLGFDRPHTQCFPYRLPSSLVHVTLPRWTTS